MNIFCFIILFIFSIDKNVSTNRKYIFVPVISCIKYYLFHILISQLNVYDLLSMFKVKQLKQIFSHQLYRQKRKQNSAKYKALYLLYQY